MVEILGRSTLTTKGQATIPKKVRAKLNLETNDLLLFVKDGDSIVLRKVEIKV